MKRRTFVICVVLSMVVFAFSSLLMQQPAKAQTSTATPTSLPAGYFGIITISGNVRDVYGATQICCESTAGVSITVSASGLHGGSGGSAVTDANGNYSVSNIQLYDTDTVTVTASKTGFPTTSIVRSGIATSTNKVFDFTLVPVTPTPYYTNTARPGCGTQMVVTSTPSPTFTPTPRVATATATTCGPIYITATPTRTVTPVVTNTNVALPDLTVSSVTYVGSNPTCANNQKVQVIVSNIGAYPANGSFLVALSGSASQTVNGLAAGQSVTLLFSASSATATVDSTNVISETNESNNSLTGNFGVPTQAPTCTPSGPTLTPTRTPTFVITNTPTRTPTTVTGTCSPVTSSITAPFTFDGVGNLCWQTTTLGGFINSWNTTSVTINGVNITNQYVAAGSYPAKIGGYWYIGYNSTVAWGHFESK